MFFAPDGTWGFSLDSVAVDGAQSFGQSVLTDVNGDGWLDSLLLSPTRQGASSWAAVAYGQANGSFAPVQMLNDSLGFARTSLVGDVTGDGKADLVWVETKGWNRGIDGKVWVLSGFNTWTYADIPGFDGTGSYALQDIDGNGVNELVNDPLNGGALKVLYFDGNGRPLGGINSVVRDATRNGGDLADSLRVETGTIGTLFGNAGDDFLNGSSFNDVLDGGSGSNRLRGGLGNDTYIVGKGDDLVSDIGGARDTLNLGSFQFNELVMSRDNDDLSIQVVSQPQIKATVRGQFQADGARAVERLQVSGSDVSVAQLIQAMNAFGATGSSWTVDLSKPAAAVGTMKALSLAGMRV